ncbi:MAG: polysaccharide ABC transporter ATP-binding protein [Chloroflexota bacterium]|nr:polysaccharide ABC transporter ATP-binding protein [Chloroflexota bacterium]
MSDTAIHVEGLGKEYRIGAQQGKKARYRTLRDTLADSVKAPFRRAAKLMRGQATGAAELDEAIWALKDVSFQVKRGEVVGIIGRNGAGKSTLLKVLSRITEPTAGYADIAGRVGSLLEVGTGFHPELTGRENVYLNGAILGMRRQEIERKFDEIVEFAEVAKFIDTPVKHYSSGMYLRLAFAVAAHLEPEILLVDEVLAVGDAAFQKKCLNKMQDVGQEGRTVLFVSHNMPAVTRLCERTILLDEGQVLHDGPSHEVVGLYLNTGLGTTAVREWSVKEAPGSDIVRLLGLRVRDKDGKVTEAMDIRRPIGIEMEYEVLKPGYTLFPHFSVTNQDGTLLFVALDQDPAWRGRTREVGHYVSTGWIPGNFLAEGSMIVGAAMRTIEPDLLHFHEQDAVAFQVIDVPNADNTARGGWTRSIPGVVRPLLEWTTEYDNRVNGHKKTSSERVRDLDLSL